MDVITLMWYTMGELPHELSLLTRECCALYLSFATRCSLHHIHESMHCTELHVVRARTALEPQLTNFTKESLTKTRRIS